MRIAVAGYKGGTAKTTTAVHLAAFFQQSAPTLLIDGDPNRSASEWAASGLLPFRVEDERKAARSGIARDFANVIVDSEARPAANDLRELAEGFELLILTSPPDALSLRALVKTIAAVAAVAGARFKVLMTICPPAPSRVAEIARDQLAAAGVPVFKTTIPRLAAFQRAAGDGVLVQDVKKSPRAGVGWHAYESAGKEIVRGQRLL
jgi:chromosome partitioning protein